MRGLFVCGLIMLLTGIVSPALYAQTPSKMDEFWSQVHLHLGQAHLFIGRYIRQKKVYEMAEKEFKEALLLNDHNYEGLYELGNLYFNAASQQKRADSSYYSYRKKSLDYFGKFLNATKMSKDKEIQKKCNTARLFKLSFNSKFEGHNSRVSRANISDWSANEENSEFQESSELFQLSHDIDLSTNLSGGPQLHRFGLAGDVVPRNKKFKVPSYYHHSSSSENSGETVGTVHRYLTDPKTGSTVEISEAQALAQGYEKHG